MGSESIHLTELAEVIGPRPATTDAEARAADYIERVMDAHGLDVERQDFDCPRTYSWAYVTYYLLTIAAAVGAFWYPVPALILGLLVAVLFYFDLETRWSLSNLMPKGPSQNIIGRYVPKARRGERTTRVVIVAHYDSAKASLAFSPSMVKHFRTTFQLMKWSTYLVPLLVLAVWLVPKPMDRWVWYAALVPAAYLLVPLFINIHRELFMKATAGANDNASGVAAMLAVMEGIAPETEASLRTERVTAADPEEATAETVLWAASELPQDDLLSFSPAGPPEGDRRRFLDDEDIDWEEAPTTPPSQPSLLDPDEELGLTDDPHAKKPAADGEGAHGISSWLGVGRDFDVRKKGRDIGSWEHFEANDVDDDPDGFGLKGGAAGPDDGSPGTGNVGEEPTTAGSGHAADEDESSGSDVWATSELSLTGDVSSSAAQIRRMVTIGIDRALSEKEIWFVATGAEEAGTWGMRAFLAENAEDLRDALIINLDNLGSGSLAYITTEGMGRKLQASRRLTGAAKRVAREQDLAIKAKEYRLLSTDATPALARSFKAMSIMAFDINGRLPNWHWATDTVENVTVGNVETAATFVTELIKEL